ncbi:hypothetical protein FG386_001223 [Cryptosporidium ryanae]|uniref:uncharacterized protein n=1 Tax=Cryptosporidium ryanae TaxID=515981 RepID=UPI00351A590C|nr:hypothetical protein FG386_001223 [Cryptosporidium ryanae]
MPIKEGSIFLKVPDYFIRRKAKTSGLSEIKESRVSIPDENVNQQNLQITNNTDYSDNLWDSPRVTPEFGAVDLASKNYSKANEGDVLNRVPRIKHIIENTEQDFGAGNNGEYELEYEGTSEYVECGIRSELVTQSKIENLNCDYSASRSKCYDDFNHLEIEEYDDSDIPAPLISSAPRFRLYDIEWDEKLRSFNRLPENISHFQGEKNEEDNINCNLFNEEQGLSLNNNHILDTIGIKGPKIFETEKGEITISEDGDFSFEFLGKEKLFTIKGGGCFIVIKNGKHVQAESESLGEEEQVIHINDLKGGNLRRYMYGVRLCETIKSFIPKVRLKVLDEGTYTLMSDHPSYPSFQAEFSSFGGADYPSILKVNFLSGQNQVVFVHNSGIKETKNSEILIERSLLEKLGVCEEAYLELNDPEKNEYILEKTHQISICGLKWSVILRAWRLSLARLLECRQLELKGLENIMENEKENI